MPVHILAQANGDAPPDLPPTPEFIPPPLDVGAWSWLHSWPNLLYLGFLAYMLWYCWKYDPDRFLWIWVMLLFYGIGPFIYFLVRFLPTMNRGDAPWTGWMKRRQRLRELESAAVQIGNPHHYLQLGDALREGKQFARAGECYAKTLAREPDNLAALWGAANVDFQKKDFASAQDRLAKVLTKDPSYKFGDVSLLYGKSLRELGENSAAKSHLEQHVRRWRHPEALFLLAQLCEQAGDKAAARKNLEDLIVDVNSSPRGIARKHVFWKSRARRMLRKLPQ